jgi:hypothetical protein
VANVSVANSLQRQLNYISKPASGKLTLIFPFYVKDNMSNSSYSLSTPIPKKQRALILQGGGALGAYEVGVFRAIYNKIIREEGEHAEKIFSILWQELQ